MSWGKGIIASLSASVAGLALMPAAALAGVVVASSGPSAGEYPVGRQIDSGERITLRDGDTLTVLENGGTRILRGPGVQMLSSSGSSQSSTFANLTRQRSQTRARTGAVRGATVVEISNPNLWYVDVETSGKICLPGPDNVQFWRADTQADSTYEISADGMATEISFEAGEMLASWNADNPPAEGTTYQLGAPTGAGAVQVEFVFTGEAPESPEAAAELFIANGCTVQLDVMTNAMMG